MITIKRKFVLAVALSTFVLGLSGCAPVKEVFNKVVTTVSPNKAHRQSYPSSALIYNSCHERWLRNGYDSYTFTVETGEYDKQVELQSGNFTTVNVLGNNVVSAESCELVYNGSNGRCQSRSQNQLKGTAAIVDYFRRWERDPSLYQSCHPVLGYPMGFGKTYGERGRRVDSDRWVMISSLVPLQIDQLMDKKPIRSIARQQKSSVDSLAFAANLLPESKGQPLSDINSNHFSYTGRYTPLTDLDVKLLSSRVFHEKGHRYLSSELQLSNATQYPAKILIKGWMLDRQYKRHPLVVEGVNGKAQETIEVEVPSHTSMTVSYQAEGAPNFTIGKRTAGMLELSSAGGVKMNLTLSN